MTTEKYIQLLELLNEFAEENGVTHHIDVYGSESKEPEIKTFLSFVFSLIEYIILEIS